MEQFILIMSMNSIFSVILFHQTFLIKNKYRYEISTSLKLLFCSENVSAPFLPAELKECHEHQNHLGYLMG